MQDFFLSFCIMLCSLLALHRAKHIDLNCSFSNRHLTSAAALGFSCSGERRVMGGALREGVLLVSELSSEIASHSSVTKVPGKGVSTNP